MKKLADLISADKFRIDIIQTVSALDADCYVAAGFLRNLIWDYLHGYSFTDLNDVDIIYFDNTDMYSEIPIQNKLKQINDKVAWQVKNQAFIHTKNNHKPYKNILDAMSFWPEEETAVAIKLSNNNELELISPFNIEGFFKGNITFNKLYLYYLFNPLIPFFDF